MNCPCREMKLSYGRECLSLLLEKGAKAIQALAQGSAKYF
jgi:hypothetical protein